jgi:hypothetical protein
LTFCWLNKFYWYCIVFINVLYLPVISLLSSTPTISHRENFPVWLVRVHFVYTCITVIDKVLLRKEVRQKGQTREYKYKKILRQCSILAVNFWSVTYFGVFNFGTSYLGAKIKPWPKFPDLRYHITWFTHCLGSNHAVCTFE